MKIVNEIFLQNEKSKLKNQHTIQEQNIWESISTLQKFLFLKQLTPPHQKKNKKIIDDRWQELQDLVYNELNGDSKKSQYTPCSKGYLLRYVHISRQLQKINRINLTFHAKKLKNPITNNQNILKKNLKNQVLCI